jgi:hypothetical protein
MKKNSPIAAASATYRIAVNGISEVLDVDAIHSDKPSKDFEDALSRIPEEMKGYALEWYERGIKRGLTKATDLMASGKIYFQANYVYAPPVIKVRVRTKMKSGDWESHTLEVSAEEIGFK